MCKWGTHVELTVTMHPDDSHTGAERVATKKIDACIAPIVKALNDSGVSELRTRRCCCGHGEYIGGIWLWDGRALAVYGSLEECRAANKRED